MICVVENLPDLIEEDGKIVEIDLSKYIFRQKTMELLYEASNLNINENHNYNQLKNRMKEFFKKMSIFMEQNNLKDDCFMKVLCEDIHISYTTLGSSDGIMFSESRNISQRDQSCYRSGSEIKRHRPSIFGNSPVKNKLTRANYIYQNYDDYVNVNSDTDDNDDNSKNINTSIFRENKKDDHDIDNYHSDFITDDVYSTQEAISIIRGVSGL
jgi:Ni,Fe-hydrogenase I large subunit